MEARLITTDLFQVEYYRDTEDSRQVRTEVMKDNLDILVVREMWIQ